MKAFALFTPVGLDFSILIKQRNLQILTLVLSSKTSSFNICVCLEVPKDELKFPERYFH